MNTTNAFCDHRGPSSAWRSSFMAFFPSGLLLRKYFHFLIFQRSSLYRQAFAILTRQNRKSVLVWLIEVWGRTLECSEVLSSGQGLVNLSSLPTCFFPATIESSSTNCYSVLVPSMHLISLLMEMRLSTFTGLSCGDGHQLLHHSSHRWMTHQRKLLPHQCYIRREAISEFNLFSIQNETME